MASTRKGRNKRWIIVGGFVLGVMIGVIWFRRPPGPRVQVDPEFALFRVEFSVGAGFLQSGWSSDRDHDQQDDLLVAYSSPHRLNLLASLMQWQRVYRPRIGHALRLSSSDGRVLQQEDFLASDGFWLHNEKDGRACYHHKPNGGNLEICSDPAMCCAPDPRVQIDLPGQSYEAYMEERGTEMYFVVEDRNQDELVLREKLGRFGQLYDWPAMRENGRCLLYYGALGSWAELSEVRLGEHEQDARWPITTERLGVPKGQLYPLHATVDAHGVSQLFAVWETPSERIFLRLGLHDELEIEQLGTRPRDVSTHAQFGAPIGAIPQGDDFLIVHARALATAPFPLILDVKLPGQDFQGITLPVELDDHDFGAISMAGGRALTPFRGPQQVILQSIADQDGDQAKDWRVLIRIGGCRSGLLVCAALSGATGQLIAL